MKEYTVTFQTEDDILSLDFSDEIENDRLREINAKMWISDYLSKTYRGEQKTFQIISIKPKINIV